MPLRYVDPHKKRGFGYRAAGSFGRSPAGQWFAREVSVRLDPWLYRATNGRVTTSMGIVVNAPLVTNGAKSGQPREVQLTYFHDGPDPILIASNFGGEKHPAWYYNLAAHPDRVSIELAGNLYQVAVEELHGNQRDLAWKRITQANSRFAEYQKKTDRELPVIRLTTRD
jgi:deazaflavin-dependent oxidoreductase (nitroreductase family)